MNLHYVMDRELWLRILKNNFNVQYLDNHKIANFRLYLTGI